MFQQVEASLSITSTIFQNIREYWVSPITDNTDAAPSSHAMNKLYDSFIVKIHFCNTHVPIVYFEQIWFILKVMEGGKYKIV